MRQDAYRTAFDEATAELSEILNQFEQLQQRKSRLERVAEVLRPLAGLDGPNTLSEPQVIETAQDAQQQAAEPAPAPLQEASEPAAASIPQYAEMASDPFQRRINNALRQGFGSGDGREYSRLFSGGVSRGH